MSFQFHTPACHLPLSVSMSRELGQCERHWSKTGYVCFESRLECHQKALFPLTGTPSSHTSGEKYCVLNSYRIFKSTIRMGSPNTTIQTQQNFKSMTLYRDNTSHYICCNYLWHNITILEVSPSPTCPGKGTF